MLYNYYAIHISISNYPPIDITSVNNSIGVVIFHIVSLNRGRKKSESNVKKSNNLKLIRIFYKVLQ